MCFGDGGHERAHHAPRPVELQPMDEGERQKKSLKRFHYSVRVPELEEDFYEIRYRKPGLDRSTTVARVKPAGRKELVIDYIDLKTSDGRRPGHGQNHRPYASQLLLAFWTKTLKRHGAVLKRLYFTGVAEHGLLNIKDQVYEYLSERDPRKHLRVFNVTSNQYEEEAFECVQNTAFGKMTVKMLEDIREAEGISLYIDYFEFLPTDEPMLFSFCVYLDKISTFVGAREESDSSD